MSTDTAAPRTGGTRRKVVLMAVRMLVVVAIVLLVVWKFDFHELHSAFDITSWPFLAGAVFANFASVAFKGLAWKGVVDGLPAVRSRTRYRDLIGPLFIGFLFNTLLAARIGEFVKVLLARRRLQARGQPVEATSLLGSVVVENLVSTITWVGLVVGIGIFLPLPRYAWIASVSLGVACLAVVVVALLSNNKRMGRQLTPWLKTGSLWARITRATVRLWGAVQDSHVALRDRGLLATVTGASLATWLAQWAGIYLTLCAFGLERVGWGGAGLLLVTVTLAQAFPVLPGNLVMFQAAAVLPLTASYGVGAAEALAFSIVLQGTEAVVGVAVGFLFLLGEGIGFGQLRREAEAADRNAHTPGPESPATP